MADTSNPIETRKIKEVIIRRKDRGIYLPKRYEVIKKDSSGKWNTMGKRYGEEGIQTYLIQNPHGINIIYFEEIVAQEEIQKMLKEKGKISLIEFSLLEKKVIST